MNRFLMALGCGSLVFAMHSPARVDKPQVATTRTIVLVRHGDYLQDPAVDKKLGPHLLPLGAAQARLAGAALLQMRLHFDHVYVSPMHRARDTAAVIATDFPGRTFEVVDDLAECNPPIPGVRVSEANTACKNRLERVFARFFKPAKGRDQADMLVCHGNVIRYLVARARGADPTTWAQMSVGNASLTTIRVEANERLNVVAVGDVDHIPLNMRTGTHADAERRLALPMFPAANPTN